MLPAAIASLVTAATFLASIPEEPGAVVLTEGAIIQAVAADLDGDGAREVLVLSGGTADGSARLDAWTDRRNGGTWSRLSNSLLAVAPAAPATPASLQGPARLVVRRIDGADRVSLLRQPAGDADCCFSVQDVIGTDAGLRLAPVAEPAITVGAAWVIDLDGDGTDEIVASRSLPPLGDISYPIEAFVYRWAGRAFEVTVTQLPAGSGDTPFLLGDTDGRPGDELGIIATRGRPELHRISLDADDSLVMEDAGLVVTDATAVPIDDGRGIAVLTPGGTLGIHPWPAGVELGVPVAQRPLQDGELLGTVEIDGTPRLVARQPGTADRLHVLGLPNLTPPRFGAVTRTPAAAAFTSGPVGSFVGPIPGGDADGRPAIVYSGRLLSSIDQPETVVPLPRQAMAVLPGAQPIGLVGADAASIALFHAAGEAGLPDPSGGRLDSPVARQGAAVSVAPLELTLTPEEEAGILEPATRGAIALDGARSIAVGSAGFAATIEAPPGSRVYVAGTDPSVATAVFAIPDGGTLLVPLPPPSVATPEPRYRAMLAVATPAGHGYLASWDVRVLTEPPPLRASTSTPVGSGSVELSGASDPFATVTVDGRPVALASDGTFTARVDAPPWPTEIVVRSVDPLGNEARSVVSAVGWFDYRQLPWIPIAAILLAGVAIVFYLRVPRPGPLPRRADDDATLEDLEPD
jgi:hypothetical protein